MKGISRRAFSRMISAAAATSAVAPLGLLNARLAFAEGNCNPASFRVDGFGPLSPLLPLNSASLPDSLRDRPLIALPPKFQYTAISIRGQSMSDGNVVPGNHDGMACFQGRAGNYILVRNHEQGSTSTGCLTANGKQYDLFTGVAAGKGGGGTSTVVGE